MLTRIARIAAVGGIVLTGTGVGFVGQRLSADGPREVHASPTRVAVAAYACPDGTQAGVLHGGDRIYVVGRGEGDDDGWLQIRNPHDLDGRWWVEASALQADGDTSGVPVAKCSPNDDPRAAEREAERAAAKGSSTTAPGEVPATDGSTTTAPDASTVPGSPTTRPSTRPTSPSTAGSTQPQSTTSTTAPPNSTTTAPKPKPSFGSLKASPSTIRERYTDATHFSCGFDSTSDITVNVSNATTATLRWSSPAGSGNKPMTKSGNKFSAELGPFPPGNPYDADRYINVWVSAVGPGGSADSAHISVILKDCTFG